MAVPSKLNYKTIFDVILFIDISVKMPIHNVHIKHSINIGI